MCECKALLQLGVAIPDSSKQLLTQVRTCMHGSSLVPTPTEDGPGIDCLRMRQPLVRF